ncbi:uncharacterized protein LOC143653520 isoform X2 [Tamandua tetradactyla]|uniref:uncharacterized protein LOC143653520 isoform X2 n=1 Tax=Tamandua tetradactyla TaxID=48850 RepID=UPI0040542EA5
MDGSGAAGVPGCPARECGGVLVEARLRKLGRGRSRCHRGNACPDAGLGALREARLQMSHLKPSHICEVEGQDQVSAEKCPGHDCSTFTILHALQGPEANEQIPASGTVSGPWLILNR